MKRATATPLPVIRLDCPKCGSVTRITRLVDTYPVKLPGCCPACMAQILTYTPEVSDDDLSQS
jgi:hypothetical protein